MSNTAIKTKDLKKRYGREKYAVKGVNLEIPKGSVYAFLGRNGAGKSTTIKMMLDLLEPTAGSLEVFGLDSHKNSLQIRERVGYVAENQKMYDWMTIDETVNFCRSFRNNWDQDFCKELIGRFTLDGKTKLKNLSRGMYAQVALILALSHHPELLILDDPTSGLDTIVRKEFMEEIIGVLHEQECTVFFSTHIIPEVENIADRIGIMNEGELILSMPLEELKASVKQIRMIFNDSVPEQIALPGILKKEQSEHEILLTVKEFKNDLLADLQKTNPVKYEIIDMNLEDIFIALA